MFSTMESPIIYNVFTIYEILAMFFGILFLRSPNIIDANISETNGNFSW